MARIVAVALPPSEDFVRALLAAWDAGDAVAPIDVRLSPRAREEAIAVLRPSVIVDELGTRELDSGIETANGDALVVQTSGTTGVSKAIVHTHASVRASALTTAAAIGLDIRHHRLLACLPVARIGGLAVITRSIVTNTPLDTLRAFDADTVQGMADKRPNTIVTSLVPTAWRRLDTASFARIVSGGMSAQGDLPPNVINSYGLTETGSGCVYDGIPLAGVEVRLAPDGRIEVRGPVLARATRRIEGDDAFDTPLADSDGWFATNDVGEWSDDRLHVLGRADDVIVTGGENVWPEPVEAVLQTHAGVADVVVVGLPDPTWGSAVTAVVVPTNNAAPPTLDELRDVVKRALPAWQAPRRLHLRAVLPRTNTGKVQRSAVIADVQSDGVAATD